MAFRKIYATQYGVNATYYIVAGVNINKISQSALITVYGYSTKQARDSGANPIHIYTSNVYPKDFDKYFSIEIFQNNPKTDQYRQGYLFLKDNDKFFEDAIDLLEDLPPITDDDYIPIPSSDIDEFNLYEEYGIDEPIDNEDNNTQI